MEKLPKNWIKIPFGEVIITKKGKKPKTTVTEPTEGYLPYILIYEMEGKGIRSYTNDEKVPIVNTEDVLLVWDGSIGKCASGIHGAIGSTLVAITPLGNIPTRFIEYFIKSKNSYIHQTSTGTGLQHINKNFFKDCLIQLPPPAEQQRIVAKLDDLFGHLDNLKTHLNHIPQILKNFRQSVLTQAVTGKLTEEWSKVKNYTDIKETIDEVPSIKLPSRYKSRNTSIIPGRFAISVGKPNLSIPDRYEWVELVKVAKLETGHTPSRKYSEYWGGSVNWIGIKDAREHHGKTIYQTIQKTNELGLKNSAARMLPKGTVCLSRTASVGYVTVMGVDMATSQDFVNWVCSQAVNPNWLKILLMAEKTAIVNFGKGTTHTTVYFPEVISINVSLPPVEEQTEIVKRVEHLFAKADAIETQYQSLKTKIDSLPQAILAKAFKGELVAQLDTDGDAKDLLEEIQQLKEALKPVKKTVKRKKKK